jgi:hypothetical protein
VNRAHLTFVFKQSQDIECATGHCSKETLFSYYQCVGTSCKRDNECETGRCDSGVCLPKLASCMICDEDSDCTYGHCSGQFRCSGENKLMDNDCLCFFNSECHSGRCEGVRPSVCEAKLGEGAYCSESSDCQSNQCTWSFHCAASSTLPSVTMAVAGSETIATNDSGLLGEFPNFILPSAFFMACVLVSLGVGKVYRDFKARGRRAGYEQIPAPVSITV